MYNNSHWEQNVNIAKPCHSHSALKSALFSALLFLNQIQKAKLSQMLLHIFIDKYVHNRTSHTARLNSSSKTGPSQWPSRQFTLPGLYADQTLQRLLVGTSGRDIPQDWYHPRKLDPHHGQVRNSLFPDCMSIRLVKGCMWAPQWLSLFSWSCVFFSWHFDEGLGQVAVMSDIIIAGRR